MFFLCGVNMSCSCTVQGQRWLTCALDPFHDTNLELAGLPDANGCPSFVTVYKQTVTITAPPGTTTPTWGCHVSNTGFTNTSASCTVYGAPTASYDNASGNNNISYGAVQNFQNSCGPVTATSRSTASGGAQFLPLTQPNESFPVQSYGLGESTNSGCRIIGQAFEVYDTSPPLYQQGSVTVYNASRTEMSLRCNTLQSTGSVPQVFVDMVSGLADDLTSAQSTPGARTWDAREGAYVVAKMVDFDPAPQYPNQSAGWTTAIASATINGTAQAPQYLWTQGQYGSYYNKGLSGFAPSGAIFSGLNTTYGSLQLTCRVVYEYFPRCTTSGPVDAFLTLSSPSAPYDACAFQMYSIAAAKLPPGVPVRMNAAGDWFKMVLRTVAASKVPYAINPILGAAVDMADRFVNGTSVETRKQKAIMNSGVNNAVTMLPATGVSQTGRSRPRRRVRVQRVRVPMVPRRRRNRR